MAWILPLRRRDSVPRHDRVRLVCGASRSPLARQDLYHREGGAGLLLARVGDPRRRDCRHILLPAPADVHLPEESARGQEDGAARSESV